MKSYSLAAHIGIAALWVTLACTSTREKATGPAVTQTTLDSTLSAMKAFHNTMTEEQARMESAYEALTKRKGFTRLNADLRKTLVRQMEEAILDGDKRVGRHEKLMNDYTTFIKQANTGVGGDSAVVRSHTSFALSQGKFEKNVATYRRKYEKLHQEFAALVSKEEGK